jgi:hypothetical protein
VILSQYPCFSMFEAVLHEIQVRWQNWNACKAFLFEVLAQPLPAPGGRIEISTVSWREPGAIDNLVFTRPSATDALFDYVNFEPMLRECDATCIVTLFSSLLVERRVVFTSDSLEALSAVVNAALALLRPLQWQYIFIPLLPRSMVGFCSSPIPFVVGLLNSSLEALRKEPHESLVLLDIDNGEFLTETPDADLIPAAEREKLLNAVKLAQQKLKRNKHLTQGDARALCDIFVAFFTVQLSGWRAHYRDNRLEIDEFVAQRADPRAKRLLTSMCSSQMFTQFAAMYSATDDAVACNSADGFVSALEQANNEVHDHAKPSRRAQLWRLRRLERGGTDGPPLAAGHHADDEPRRSSSSRAGSTSSAASERASGSVAGSSSPPTSWSGTRRAPTPRSRAASFCPTSPTSPIATRATSARRTAWSWLRASAHTTSTPTRPPSSASGIRTFRCSASAPPRSRSRTNAAPSRSRRRSRWCRPSTSTAQTLAVARRRRSAR